MIWINSVFLLIYIVFLVVFIKLAFECRKGAKRCHESYLEHDNDTNFKKLRNDYYALLGSCITGIAVSTVVMFYLFKG